jgi:predicted heme/steroid binding protein/uncharacterized membrane protein
MDMDIMDTKELEQNDGKEGRPTYISASGRVIDVSASKLWKGGLHMGRHHAGKDLTADLGAAPHGTEVLDRYPQVGTLQAAPAEPALPSWLSGLLMRYPLLRRHPHPALVHFPIVFSVSASFFSVLSVLTGDRSFDQTAFYCLVGAVLFMPLGIITGFATWWINYMARPMRPATIKKNLSCATVVVIAFLAGWRAFVPGVLDITTASGVVYLMLVVALTPAVLTVGFYGGLLTFPVEKRF